MDHVPDWCALAGLYAAPAALGVLWGRGGGRDGIDFRNESKESNVPRGGKRNGAGRKKGSATLKTREIADRIAAEDVTPLQVMIEAMNDHRAAGRLDKAAAIAKDAAPYMHPRLSYVKSDVSHSDADADEALETELEELYAERKAAGPHPPQDQEASAEPPHPRRNGRGPVAGADSP